MRQTIRTCIMLLGITGVYFVSCQTAQQESQLDQLDMDSSNDLSDDSTESDADQSQTDFAVNAPHPKQANAWFTRKLLMTSKQPSADSTARCKERVDSTAAQASNLRALDEIAAGFEANVNSNPKVYHWCFYQMMSDLDIQLAKDTPLMDEKAGLFLTRMRSLWVLAKALDASNQTGLYMRYLRARYTEISQNIFGRNLEQMDVQDFRLPVKSHGKSAAAFDE